MSQNYVDPAGLGRGKNISVAREVGAYGRGEGDREMHSTPPKQ